MAGAEGDGVPEAACGALVVARTPHQGASGAVNRFRGGLVFKARRRVYHSTPGSRVIKKKKVKGGAAGALVAARAPRQGAPGEWQRESSLLTTY